MRAKLCLSALLLLAAVCASSADLPEPRMCRHPYPRKEFPSRYFGAFERSLDSDDEYCPCSFGAKCGARDQHTVECSCNIECPKGVNSICGSNGRIYESACHMAKESCETQEPIRRMPKGYCKKPKRKPVY